MSNKKPLDDEQAKVLDEADRLILDALDRATSEIKSARLDVKPPDEDDMGCRRCGCDGFTGSLLSRCTTPRCGHSFFLHRVF